MNVLAIGCHPDDIEIACAGTLAKCVRRGDHVVAAHLCTGSLGHVEIPPETLVPMR
ncbi:MAG: PIG-L family deacetylase, partial [Kiritimatiellae bacterium]|nr:PIG-L family deacetylase [Kiritimatiellia bacterium]